MTDFVPCNYTQEYVEYRGCYFPIRLSEILEYFGTSTNVEIGVEDDYDGYRTVIVRVYND